MDAELMKSLLDTIEEQVVDEDKIVTYKSLSKNLKVHVNTAKQLLHTFVTQEKSKNSYPISATYLLAGKLVDGSFNVTVVNEVDLKNAHSEFVEVTSEHVYSVQKGEILKDIKVLSGVDKESSKSSDLVIKCSKGILKESKIEVKKKPESYEEQNKEVIKQALVPEKKPVSESGVNKKVDEEVSSRKQKKTSPKGNSEKAQPGSKKPSGTIANLFAKAAQRNLSKPAPCLKADKNDSQTESKAINEVDPVIENEVKDVQTTNHSEEETTESKDNFKRKKKGNKRKRIHVLTDSEESDSDESKSLDGNIETERENPPSPVINLEDEKEEIQESAPRNKRKKRKVIDKTIMNEDGYLETKKEVVFETDSENEPEETIKISGKTKSLNQNDKGKAVQSGSTAKKQASLLTFFKKS